MKRISLLLLTSLLTLPLVHAQYDYSYSNERNERHRKLRIGVYIAPTTAWMRPTTKKAGDNDEFKTESNGSKLGFMYGLMADVLFAENYMFSTGLQLNMTGGSVLVNRDPYSNAASTVNKADFTYSLQYIEIPAALKLRTDEIGGFHFFGQFGLTLGINISKNGDYHLVYNDEAGMIAEKKGEGQSIKGSFAITPIQLQMNIGAGLEYPLSNKISAYFGVFFNNGFIDATNPNNYELGQSGHFADGNIRSNNFAFRLGLLF